MIFNPPSSEPGIPWERYRRWTNEWIQDTFFVDHSQLKLNTPRAIFFLSLYLLSVKLYLSYHLFDFLLLFSIHVQNSSLISLVIYISASIPKSPTSVFLYDEQTNCFLCSRNIHPKKVTVRPASSTFFPQILKQESIPHRYFHNLTQSSFKGKKSTFYSV